MSVVKYEFKTEVFVSLFNFEGDAGRGSEKYGGVAQLGEHLPCKQGVMGSNPIISTSGKLPRPISELVSIKTKSSHDGSV